MSEPVSKAILLCNFAIQDRSNRWSLIAMFDRINTHSVPVRAASFHVYIRIADAPPRGTSLIQVEDAAGMVVWTSGALTFENERVAQYTEAAFVVPPILFPSYGRYRVAFFMNSDRLMDTDLVVAPITENAHMI